MKQKIGVLISALFMYVAFAGADPPDLVVEQALREQFEVTELRCHDLRNGSLCDFRVVARSRGAVTKALREILETLPDDYEFRIRGHVTATGFLKSDGRVYATRGRDGEVASQVMPSGPGGGGGSFGGGSPSAGSPSRRTFGTECTTYTRGNTSGISCHSW